MAGALTWSQAALEDIEAIAEFIGRESPRHATRVATALFELGDVIAVHPLAHGRRLLASMKARFEDDHSAA